MKKHPAPLAKFLSSKSKNMAPLIAEAKRLMQIKIILNQSLDHELSKHIQVSRLENNQLRLMVDSPAWATRLRYKQADIINCFQNYAISKIVKSIHIKISPDDVAQKKNKPKINNISLSVESADQMLEEIEAISDSSLKDALTRITRHAK
ncbi:MAG: DUF721 domain-containing protein [Gammaproteobacteria bacterium]|nr:DUF721 domain-containing protein [Gammaproteobacteria bacterium]